MSESNSEFNRIAKETQEKKKEMFESFFVSFDPEYKLLKVF